MMRLLAGIACGLAIAVVSGCGEGSATADKAAAPAAMESRSEAPPPRYAASASIPADGIQAATEVSPDGPEPREAAEGIGPGMGGDKHAYLPENPFIHVGDAPLSTFSVDVDTASYSKVRAYLLEQRSLPPPDAVRIEELVNYFDYDYAPPGGEHPFAVHLESAACPWQAEHRLVRCGIQGKLLDQQRPPSNLVFLVDVSGSMDAPNKLPLVKQGLEMLVRQLGENDRVAIVVYAGAAGQALPSTSGQEQSRILAALDSLHAGGSTNGGQGIQLAYRIAQDHFIPGGVNRVILCSDGDFNVGVTSTGELVRLAIERARAGVFLSVLGFGFGNHNDALLEEIADKADGNYAFIDTPSEARKVLVDQMSGTLVTIAKDVKIQVEFNPAHVAAYRLIGYENRLLADRDFNDDAKDAGEIGAGHRVTALYEIVPSGVSTKAPLVDPLKYQPAESAARDSRGDTSAVPADVRDELLTLKLRYQPPQGGASALLTFPVKDSGHQFGQASHDFQFAAAVASFGMLLRRSEHRGATSYAAVLETATAACGTDKHGYRAEFLELVKSAQRLSSQVTGDKSSIPPGWNEGRRPPAGQTGYLAHPSRCAAAPIVQSDGAQHAVRFLLMGVASGICLTATALGATVWAVGRLTQGRFVSRVPVFVAGKFPPS